MKRFILLLCCVLALVFLVIGYLNRIDFTYPGEYTNYGGDYITISETDNGNYHVELFFYRLTYIDDGVGSAAGDTLSFSATDSGGNPIYGELKWKHDNRTLILTFTDSQWPYIETGMSYEFYRQ